MFLTRPPPSDSPTIEPLRIFKQDSRSPESDRYAQHSAFPLPPGASSSPAPLPYPDDRPRVQRPANGRSTTDDSDLGSPSHAASPPRAGSGSSDSSRPSKTEYPLSLRPSMGRDGQAASRLAERRGNVPKPLPDSPGPEAPEKEDLFQKTPQRDGQPASQAGRKPPTQDNPYPEYHQQYWPPPGESSSRPSNSGLAAPKPLAGVTRLSSTASTSTTKAQRGSPPPPETPIIPPGEQPPGGGIEARFAAAGIAGNSTLTSLQAQNAAAAQRANQYPQPTQQRPEPARRWTPTEAPGSQPHGPPTVYQGPGQAASPPPIQAPTPQGRTNPTTTTTHSAAVEADIQRMHVSHSPPPAYTPASTTTQGFPNEKHTHTGAGVPAAAGATAAGTLASAAIASAAIQSPQSASHEGHPAFAHDPRPESSASQRPAREDPAPAAQQSSMPTITTTSGTPAQPPPLPEGWISHLDQSSGQYYYIHLPTQSTQWEFPKGPTPLNLDQPLSPTGSISFHHGLASPGLSVSALSGKPLASPGLHQPLTPYAESFMSSTPTLGGFTGPPPSAGVEMYKIAPTNSVYFGPYLRYTNMDLERGVWLGSILLVTEHAQPPTIHIHQSVDLSPNPRQLKASSIHTHQRWTFYRYDIDLQMDEETSSKWTYAITSHLGCTRYEFLVAGRHETNWRFIACSGNDFSLNVSANDRTKIGGIGYMWKDIMQKHVECGGFHTQLGLGDQIYADRIWKEVPLLKQWLAMSGKDNRKNAQWTAKHEEDVSHAYFHYYTSHFDQPYLREAFAQIPHVLQIDDHDM